MSVISYYNDALETILDKVKNYTDDDEIPLLEDLLDFCRNLKIDLKKDIERINHIEYIRDLEESGKRYDCYNI
jgi:hypothetical protein